MTAHAAASRKIEDLVVAAVPESDTHLINLVSLTPVGTEAELRILRGTEIVAVQVKVGNRAEIE